MKKLKWKRVYFPIGEWVDEIGDVINVIDYNFRAFYGGVEILVLMIDKSCEGITCGVPHYFNSSTLGEIKLSNNDYIEVEESKVI